MEIFITDFARAQIHTIYFYHKIIASLRVAQKIKSEIDAAILRLKEFPESGQVEESIHLPGKTYRRIIAGNYKIIYCIEVNRIFITDVFDSRQNPANANA